jgi:hypothetical protein
MVLTSNVNTVPESLQTEGKQVVLPGNRLRFQATLGKEHGEVAAVPLAIPIAAIIAVGAAAVMAPSTPETKNQTSPVPNEKPIRTGLVNECSGQEIYLQGKRRVESHPLGGVRPTYDCPKQR